MHRLKLLLSVGLSCHVLPCFAGREACNSCLALLWHLLPVARGRAAPQVAFNALIPCMLFTKVGATLAAQSDPALLVIPLVALAQARSQATTQVARGVESPIRCTTSTSLCARRCPLKLPERSVRMLVHLPSTRAVRHHVPGIMHWGSSTTCAGQCNQGTDIILLVGVGMAVHLSS